MDPRLGKLASWLFLVAWAPACSRHASPDADASTSEEDAGPPVALGAFILDRTPPVNGYAPFDPSAMTNYAAMVGGKPAIVMWYQKWAQQPDAGGGVFPATQLDAIVAFGADPMVTWEGCAIIAGGTCDRTGAPSPIFSDKSVAAGTWDGYLQAWASAAKAWGKPFFLRLNHEMNGEWYSWGTGPKNPNGNTPADYVAAWQHVHAIFDAVGATNVKWVWSPNVDMINTSPIAANYPGDAWVDWIALDGYNWGPRGTWQSFHDVFGASYDEITGETAKPLMFAEVGCAPDGGDKGEWITQGFLKDLPASFPRVRAAIWYDDSAELDWRVNSSPDSLVAWQAVVGNPKFQGPPPLGGPYDGGY